MKILLVCTGNTCRSPLAQVLLERLRPQWSVRSAGIQAQPGPASEHSRQVAQELGLDLSRHRSQGVTPELLAWADQVVGMTEGHCQALRRLFPWAPVTTLGQEISDPFGQSLSVYQRCAQEIEQGLRAWLNDQIAAAARTPETGTGDFRGPTS